MPQHSMASKIGLKLSNKLSEYQEQPYPIEKSTIVFHDPPKKCVTFAGYSWNSQWIFLYSILPGYYFGIFPGISLGIFSEHTGDISRECSTNISRTYTCRVGNGLVRKVTAFVKSSIFGFWYGSISVP